MEHSIIGREVTVQQILDLKLSPCFICSAFSFGYLPGVWVLKADVSEQKPSKQKCILITLTEMEDSTLANPGNHCYTTSRKRDGHRINRGTLPDTPYIPPPSPTSCSTTHPLPVTRLPIGSARACLNPVRYKYPAHSKPCHTSSTCLWRWNRQSSETSAFSTRTPGRYPKENALHSHLIFTNPSYLTQLTFQRHLIYCQFVLGEILDSYLSPQTA